MQIVLDTYGLKLSARNGCFQIASETEKRLIHPDRVSGFLITMPCRISTPAILLAAKNDITVTICTNTGKPEARLWSSRFRNISSLRRNQYGFTDSSSGVEWVRSIILTKLENQMNNVKYLKTEVGKAVRIPDYKEFDLVVHNFENAISNLSAIQEPDIEKIRVIEAIVAKNYWQLTGKSMPAPFAFEKRKKRQPDDEFNPCLNYLYGMLRNHVETAVLSIGLDPALGCMHRDGYKLPSLVFDLMEPFRPLIDKVLFDAILNGKLDMSFEKDEAGITCLEKPGRKTLIELFYKQLYKRCRYKEFSNSLNHHILSETKNLAEQIRNYGK